MLRSSGYRTNASLGSYNGCRSNGCLGSDSRGSLSLGSIYHNAATICQNPWGNRGIRLSPDLPGGGKNRLQGGQKTYLKEVKIGDKEVPLRGRGRRANLARKEGYRLLVRGL